MTGTSSDHISLDILICDRDPITRSLLVPALSANPLVSSAEIAESVEDANDLLRAGNYSAIFIDPLALGLDEASEFIFKIRQAKPHIVFVLFFDRTVAESNRDSFYYGKRRRFAHYFTLDKRTPLSAFQEEVQAALESCSSYILSN